MSNYTMNLGETLDAMLILTSSNMGVDKKEALRRAITLAYHASLADKVVLVTNGVQQKIIIK